MKSFYLTMILFVAVSILLTAQNNESFWNDAMIKLADNSSGEGWIKIREDKKFSHNNFFTLNKEAFKLKENDQMVLEKSYTDNFGFTHHKFQQTYKNIPVEGCEYILHEKNGFVISANGKIASNLSKNVVPNIGEATALNVALQFVNASRYAWQVDLNDEEDSLLYSAYPKGELLLAFKKNIDNYTNDNYELTYRFEITSVKPKHNSQAVYVNAHNGTIFKTIPLQYSCHCCTGSTNTLYYGTRNITTQKVFPNKYLLKDNCRGGGIQAFYNKKKVRDPNNNFVNNHKDRVAASAHWAAEMTYDYFLNNHGRNSFDNNGAKVDLYTGEGNDDEASWKMNSIYLGKSGSKTSNDLVSLDIVGHEFTHGVTQYSAKLQYSNESGALNESFSDIFGTMIEYYALNGSGDYLIGEDFWITDGYLRNMSNPGGKTQIEFIPNCPSGVYVYAQPNTYKGVNWLDYNNFPNCDLGGVHKNSGVQNFWFYLLSEGGTGTNDKGYNYTVQGIGREKAASIAYRNLTVYLTSTSKFSDAKNGAIWSAMDLFGDCSNEVLQTIRAWDAVGVPSNGGLDFALIVNCSELNLFHNLGQPYTARAIHSLESNCSISLTTSAPVNFIAGQYINLTAGFDSGANFDAYIDPCLSSVQMRTTNYTDETSTTNPLSNKDDIIFDKQNVTNVVFETELNMNVYPNPVENSTTIEYSIPSEELVTIEIYDTKGVLLNQLCMNKMHSKGAYQLNFDTSNLPSGTYFCFIKTLSIIKRCNIIKMN